MSSGSRKGTSACRSSRSSRGSRAAASRSRRARARARGSSSRCRPGDPRRRRRRPRRAPRRARGRDRRAAGHGAGRRPPPTERRRSRSAGTTTPDVVLMDLEMPVHGRDRGDAQRSSRRRPRPPCWSSRRSRIGGGSRERSTPAPSATCSRTRRRTRSCAASAPRPRAARRSIRAPRGRCWRRKSAPDPLAGISPREREVLALLLDGMPNKLIARRLEISEKTVKSHLTSIFRQIGVTDRVQAILWVERQGLRDDLRPVDARCDQSPVAAPTRRRRRLRVCPSPASARIDRRPSVLLLAVALLRSSPPGRSRQSPRTATARCASPGVCGKRRDLGAEAQERRRRHRAAVQGRSQPCGRRLARRARAGAPDRLEGRREDDRLERLVRGAADAAGSSGRRRGHRARLGAARPRLSSGGDPAGLLRHLIALEEGLLGSFEPVERRVDERTLDLRAARCA